MKHQGNRAWLLVAALAYSSLGLAQEALSPDISSIQEDYQFGKYRVALERANARIDQGSLAEPELLELHRMAAISAFNLTFREQAQRHFDALLRLDPDFALDPFSVPPPTVEFFEGIRRRLGPEAARLRSARSERHDRAKRDADLRAQVEKDAELTERRAAEVASLVRPSPRSLLVNFIPFGAGQFQEGRVGFGAGFAVGEGLLGGASILSFLVYNSFLKTETVQGISAGRQGETVTRRGIPPDKATVAGRWQSVQVWSGVGFYLLYATGIVEALVHYGDANAESPAGRGSRKAGIPPPLKPRAHLQLLPSGAGVGVSMQF